MKTQLKTLTPLECNKLLRYLQCPPDSKAPPKVHHRNYTMSLVMLDAGLRVGELVQLRQEQLWFADCPVLSITVERDQAKNKRERPIPITSRLRDAIEKMHYDWWGHSWPEGTHYAFYQVRHSSPLTTRQVHRIISSAGKHALGADIHPHLLRHTLGSRLMRTTSMRVVQEILGHSSITSTQIYTHPNSDDRQKAIDSLNQKE